MILLEAQGLLDKEDYNATIDMLAEADKAIDQKNSEQDEEETNEEKEDNDDGEVLGAEEVAEDVSGDDVASSTIE